MPVGRQQLTMVRSHTYAYIHKFFYIDTRTSFLMLVYLFFKEKDLRDAAHAEVVSQHLVG